MKTGCGVLTTNSDLQIGSVFTDKWHWQLITFKCQKWTRYQNHYWQRNDISLCTFLIFTCLPHPPHTSATSTCISAPDKNPNLMIPLIPQGNHPWEEQLEKTFPTLYRYGRVITVHKSLVFTILCKMDPVHILPLIKDPFQYHPTI